MSYFSEQTFASKDLQIAVVGVGDLQLPLSAEATLQLIRQAKPAHYGRKSQTLLDTTVRDTAEIAASDIQLHLNPTVMARLVAKLAQDLALDAQEIATPELHNLLIYGKGQFFKPHQDSEKAPGMVASLVVVLPSPHIGGDLVVHHGKGKNKKTHHFVSQNLSETNLRCLAFYADCQHEVERVQEGYRVALTFNVSLRPEPVQTGAPSGQRAAQGLNSTTLEIDAVLKNYVQDFFADPELSPPLLAYFLDHQYTQKSLGWRTLKGKDRALVKHLQAIAQQLQLTPHLALAEIHESWSCWSEDEEPDEIIVQETSLDYWVDAHGKTCNYGSQYISDHHVYCERESDEDDLEESEHEGYMGNYGNTMEYWYRRAALVLWPASEQSTIEFKFEPQSAWRRLAQSLTEAGHAAQVQSSFAAMAQSLRMGGDGNGAAQLPIALAAAAYVGDPVAAQTLLASVDGRALNADCAQGLQALSQRFGAPWLQTWLQERLTEWTQAHKTGHSSYGAWPPLDALVRKLQKAHLDHALIQAIAQMHLAALLLHNQSAAQGWGGTPRQLLADAPMRLTRLRDVLGGLVELHDTSQAKTLADHVLAYPLHYPLLDAADAVLGVADGLPTAGDVLKALIAGLQRQLKARVDQPIRASDDWSMKLTLRCSCQLCKETLEFSGNASAREKIWSIVMSDRDHVMQQASEQLWGLHFEVLKKGSPHKLVINKAAGLHGTEAKERESAQRKLAALERL